MALTIDLASVDNVNLLSLDTDTPGKSLWFILFRLPASAKAGAMLKEGDKAQAVTLTLLEKTRPFMEKDLHDRLHEKYDWLRERRLQMKPGFLKRATQWEKIAAYREDSVELSGVTVVSSERARSLYMWKKKSQKSAPESSVLSVSNSDHAGVDEVESILSYADSTAPGDGESVNGNANSNPIDIVPDGAGQPPQYGICEVDPQGCLNTDSASVISPIELHNMLTHGVSPVSGFPIHNRPSGDDPFADDNKASASSTFL